MLTHAFDPPAHYRLNCDLHCFFAMTTVSQPVFGLQLETYTQNAHIKYLQG